MEQTVFVVVWMIASFEEASIKGLTVHKSLKDAQKKMRSLKKFVSIRPEFSKTDEEREYSVADDDGQVESITIEERVVL